MQHLACRATVTISLSVEAFVITEISTTLQIRVEPSLASIPAADWDACATGDDASGKPNPFVSHAFLLALEVSGCTGGRSGWNPAALAAFVVAYLVAAAPLLRQARAAAAADASKNFCVVMGSL